MLVLSRKEGEQIVVGDNIKIMISRIDGNRVAIGIEAPKNVKIIRSELQGVPVPTAADKEAVTTNGRWNSRGGAASLATYVQLQRHVS